MPNYIAFKSKIYRLEHLLGMHYLKVEKETIQLLGGKISSRVLCTINQIPKFHAGLVALGEGNAYISINTKRMKKYGLKEGDEINVILEKDESEFGMEVPEELVELFAQDEVGFERFNDLTPGKQRYIIHYVSSVKNSQLRIDRAILLISNLKRLPKGKESFREILGMEKRD